MSCLIFFGSSSALFGIFAPADELDSVRKADTHALVFDAEADARTHRARVMVVVRSISERVEKITSPIYSPAVIRRNAGIIDFPGFHNRDNVTSQIRADVTAVRNVQRFLVRHEIHYFPDFPLRNITDPNGRDRGFGHPPQVTAAVSSEL
jgi:hypothetical protein